jgi:hypothetical protein
MAQGDKVAPRNYFLNELHELTPSARTGGGRAAQYAPLHWEGKSDELTTSLSELKSNISNSQDPLKDFHTFAFAVPEPHVRKLTSSKKKSTTGEFEEKIDFNANHGKVFERLGLELIEVSRSGQAVVHGENSKFDELRSRVQFLAEAGLREQSRWITLNSFDVVPWTNRIDSEWLESLTANDTVEVVFELQPVISRVEANTVLESISELVSQRDGARLLNIGNDFSGRYWIRGKLYRSQIKQIAETYFSVQSIHPPLFSYFFSHEQKSDHSSIPVSSSVSSSLDKLPCVAVVDTGIPSDHIYLRDFYRGSFVQPDANTDHQRDHGSFVASRAVFGDFDTYEEFAEADGACSYYDVPVADHSHDRVNDKLVLSGLAGVRGAAPDVRVFNLSFGDYRPMVEYSDLELKERRLQLQDLDNFIFANDVVVVVAAGNSIPGVTPNKPYPEHIDDPRWALGAWACGYNTMVCGSHVTKLSMDSVALKVGFPSPFTRVGYGINQAPVPTFTASGGNCNSLYGSSPGLGVFGFTRSGTAEDRVGTSYAAPILAREAALAIESLKNYCPGGTEPSAVLVKACLALFAKPTNDDKQILELSKRTLGLGETSFRRLLSPNEGFSVIAWQGVIESSKDIVRVRLPVPKKWVDNSDSPQLTVSVCHDSPVNQACETWACRKIDFTLRVNADDRAASATRSWHRTYPLFIRKYDLKKISEKYSQKSDFVILELKYTEIGPYAPGMIFDPRQRVAICAELSSGDNVDPQEYMQSLPFANEFNRLSIRSDTRTPVLIRSRV